MLFYLSLVAFSSLLVMLTYRYRAFIVPHIPERVKSLFPKLHNYTPLSTFSDQVGLGLSSNDFDIEANIRSGDSRTGLDETGTQEVLEIMRRERVNFDQARLVRQNRILARNGIDPSGMPLDSKAITRLIHHVVMPSDPALFFYRTIPSFQDVYHLKIVSNPWALVGRTSS